jgi:hypothetical protein
MYFIAVRLTSSEEAGLHLLPRTVSIKSPRIKHKLMNDSTGFYRSGIPGGRIVYANDWEILPFQPRVHMPPDIEPYFDNHLESTDFTYSGVG